MKILLATALTFAAALPAAQNLVPDSSFENNKAIPSDFSGIGNSYTWSRPSMGTTDLFCEADRRKTRTTVVGVPQNAMGYQYAHSGTCYAGFFLFSHDDYREYLQTPLTKALEKGKTYFLSFYISLADLSQTYIDQLGFCFLPAEEHYQTGDVLDQLKPVYIQLDKVRRDTMKWHRVTATYEASGEEKYFLLGSFELNKIKKTNFKFPKKFKTPINKAGGRDAYYFIDDVSLVEWINPPLKKKKDTVTMVTPEADKPLVLKNVQFKGGDATLQAASFETLDVLALYLLAHPQQEIEVRGHTDNIGSPESNKQLSERRAMAVADYLVAKGVFKENIISRGYGDTLPLVPNDSDEHRAINRRVEIVFIK
jgi:OmpA-OmpF porin, OOP family